MRLICPNCGAQYAVAEGVIPSGGRDVQCSNCAHTWFETPGGLADDLPPAPRKISRPVMPATEEKADPYSGSINDAFKDADDENLAPAPQRPVDRKPVDRSVADILREEAALETAQRRVETPSTMESQSDLGLSDPTPEPPKRPAPVAEEPAPEKTTSTAAVDVTAAAAAASASRRELLPDIEEINSSLRSDAERHCTNDTTQTAVEKRSGFRRGFLTVLIVLMLLVGLYIFAGQLGTMVPALADTLQSYVDTVDVGRIWLDDSVQSMLTSIAAE